MHYTDCLNCAGSGVAFGKRCNCAEVIATAPLEPNFIFATGSSNALGPGNNDRRFMVVNTPAPSIRAKPTAFISPKNLNAIKRKGMAYATGFDTGGQTPLYDEGTVAKLEARIRELEQGQDDLIAVAAAALQDAPIASSVVDRPDDFSRGYFCATAVLLRETGTDDSEVRSLFSQGGDPTKADEFDIELFREHGLMPKGGA